MAGFQNIHNMDDYVPMHPHQHSMHYAHVPQMTQRDSPMSREPKGKRKQVGRACAQCAAAHVACSEHRPCTRCSKRGIPCQDRERKRRRRLEHDEDGENDPMLATAGFMIPSHGSLGPMYLPPMGHFPADYSFPEYFGHKTFGGFDDKMPRGFPFNEPGVKQEDMYPGMHPDFHLQPYYPHPHEEYPPLPAGYPYGFQSHFHPLPHPPYEEEPLPGQVLQPGASPTASEKFSQMTSPSGSYGVPGFGGFPQFENLGLPTALPVTLPAPLSSPLSTPLPSSLSAPLSSTLSAPLPSSLSPLSTPLSSSLSVSLPSTLSTPLPTSLSSLPTSLTTSLPSTLPTPSQIATGPSDPVSPPIKQEQTPFKPELGLPPLSDSVVDAPGSS